MAMYKAILDRVIVKIEKEEAVSASGIYTSSTPTTENLIVVDAIDYSDLEGREVKVAHYDTLDGGYASVRVEDILAVVDKKD